MSGIKTFLNKITEAFRKQDVTLDPNYNAWKDDFDRISKEAERLQDSENPQDKERAAALLSELNVHPFATFVSQNANKLNPDSKEFKEIQRRISNVGSAIADSLKIGTSMSQIREGRRAVRRAEQTRPELPAKYTLNPELKFAMNRARELTNTPALAPEASFARQGISDAYRESLMNAQRASAGQAGVFAANANRGYQDRLRATLGASAQLGQTRLANQDQYNQLLGEATRERQFQATHNAGVNRDAFNRYMQDAQFAGNLQAMGHRNLFTSLDDMVYNAPSYLTPSIRTMQQNTMLPEFDSMSRNVGNSLMKKIHPEANAYWDRPIGGQQFQNNVRELPNFR